MIWMLLLQESWAKIIKGSEEGWAEEGKRLTQATYPWKPTGVKIEKCESKDDICHLKYQNDSINDNDNNGGNKQLLDEVEHDIMNYQNWGLCYLPKPKAEADNTDTRVW